jgi:uncharacterized protein (TIGR02145 family)
MNRVKLVVLAVSVSLTWFVGCTSADIEDLPQPTDYSSGVDMQISSSSFSSSNAETQNWCVYPSSEQCFPGSFTDCPSNGILALNCPYSSSSAGLNGSSSSVGGTDNGNSSSSSKVSLEYAWCVFLEEQNCLPGPVSVCPPGGTLANVCPYVSSSSVGGKSSESQGTVQFDGDEFIDPRDGKRYKYEMAPNGRVWMSENLNYSKNNTLGYCYKAGQATLGSPGENGAGCDRPYGRHYTWKTAMAGNNSQGLCPSGWHIPSVAEWETITRSSSIMSSDFYVYAGNFNVNPKYPPINEWKERTGDVSQLFDDRGLYWTSQSADDKIFFIVMVPFGERVGMVATPSDDASNDDYFSVRCIMDVAENCASIVPGISFCDEREDIAYSTIVIGEKTWMSKDLTLGGKSKYDWATAMALPSSCNNDICASQINTPHQGICPEGWHLPSAEENTAEWKAYVFSQFSSGPHQGFWTAEEGGAPYFAIAVEPGFSGPQNKGRQYNIRCVKN